jgi:succinate dehydrogenase iron-sulfur subunit
MQVALKIWRFDPATGQKVLRDYEVDAPDWATLLDVLDIVKDRVDGSLAYRKSCRMMICGSCGMRMDGAAVLACKTRMYEIAEAGHVPVVSAMGNLPVIKDLVVDMGPFWAKMRAMQPYLQPGFADPGDKEYRVTPEEVEPIHKEALCINCGCCVSECNSMEADPEFLGPAALAKGMRFVGDTRDGRKVERLESYQRASTHATRSRSWAPRRSSRASTATWARSTRSGSCSRRRRRAGCERRSSFRRRRGISSRSRRSSSR